MTGHHRTHFLPYSSEQLYDLVADVRKYPEFLPFCLACDVISESETEIVADLKVGTSFLKETFRSRVHLTPKSGLQVEYIKGPFQHLKTTWEFNPTPPNGTDIVFFIEFKFANTFFQKAIQGVFEGMFEKMLEAFEKRAHLLYGDGQGT